jgi:hypothetical protein
MQSPSSGTRTNEVDWGRNFSCDGISKERGKEKMGHSYHSNRRVGEESILVNRILVVGGLECLEDIANNVVMSFGERTGERRNHDGIN